MTCSIKAWDKSSQIYLSLSVKTEILGISVANQVCNKFTRADIMFIYWEEQ